MAVAAIDATLEKYVNLIQHMRITSKVKKKSEADDARSHEMSIILLIESCGDWFAYLTRDIFATPSK